MQQQTDIQPPTCVTADGHDIGPTWGHDPEFLLEQMVMATKYWYEIRRHFEWGEPHYKVNTDQWPPTFWRQVALCVRAAGMTPEAWVDLAIYDKADDHAVVPPPAVLTSGWLKDKHARQKQAHADRLLYEECKDLAYYARLFQQMLNHDSDGLERHFEQFIETGDGNQLFGYIVARQVGREEFVEKYEFAARYRLAMVAGLEQVIAEKAPAVMAHLLASTEAFAATQAQAASETWLRLTGIEAIDTDKGVSQ